MTNLQSNADGEVWCPKVNKEVQVTGLLGCQHCEYADKIERIGDTGIHCVGCKLLPTIQICKRQRFLDNCKMVCMQQGTVDQYQSATGDLSEPDGAKEWLPMDTDHMKCWTCATQERRPSIPIQEGMVKFKTTIAGILEEVKKGNIKGAATKASAALREAISKLNEVETDETEENPSETIGDDPEKT